MKTIIRVLLPPVIVSFVLVSCTAVSAVGEGSMSLVRKTTDATTSRVAKLSDLVNPAGVKVVEVREKDLKPLPTGQERAIAFENTRKRGFWSFMGPVDFKEPTLPQPGGELDGSLLPPKTQ
ncbi:MAG TPA: hypothetical protein VF258_10655 [Luteolibacter sp.]